MSTPYRVARRPAPELPDPPIAWFDAPCLTSYAAELASGTAWNRQVHARDEGLSKQEQGKAARRAAADKAPGGEAD